MKPFTMVRHLSQGMYGFRLDARETTVELYSCSRFLSFDDVIEFCELVHNLGDKGTCKFAPI